MPVTIAVTGSDGAMGGEVVAHLLASKENFTLRLFVHDIVRHYRAFFKKLLKKGRGRVTVVRGDLKNYDDVALLLEGADYVVHCGAVIPPKSDHNVENTVNTNFIGTKNIVDAIASSGRDIKLIHISTVALYGNRNHLHPWARMGDPVMPSAFDYYAANKARGERYVLENPPRHFVVLRQSAMYHKYFLINNLADGLMFHTCWNAPLEWVTDKDSGLCIEHLIERDLAGLLSSDPKKTCYPDKDSNYCKAGFWQNAFNIGGGEGGRETGYETFNSGFALMGASARKFFNPNWNIPRNFHGVWYTDSHVLNDWLDYRRETNKDYWKWMKKTMWYYSLGAIVPSILIRKLAIERLLSNTNSPQHWLKLGKKGRIDAFFGGRAAYDALPTKWDDFPLISEGEAPVGTVIKSNKIDGAVQAIDYKDLKDESKAVRYRLNHGYDETKPDNEIDITDLKSAAKWRGGEVLSKTMKKGDLFTRIEWKCHEGHTFSSNPFAILKAGFWCPTCCTAYPKWQFDKVAPKVPFYSQVWFDTHDKSECDNVYPYDEKADEDMMRPVEKL